MRYYFFCLFLVLALITPKAVQAAREIPDDNLAYPVFIRLQSGSTGSGFFLNMDENTYLVTASHVLFDESTGDLKSNQATTLSYSKNPKETERNILELDLKLHHSFFLSSVQ